VVSEEGTRAEMGDEDDDLLRAAEELGIDLSGVRASDGDSGDDEATEESEEDEPDEDAEIDAGVIEADLAEETE
jgi:DNA-directed RNA polymerase subunit beta